MMSLLSRPFRLRLLSSLLALPVATGAVVVSAHAAPGASPGVRVEALAPLPDDGSPGGGGKAIGLPAGSLRNGLEVYLPLDGSLEATGGAGQRPRVSFERGSPAYTEALRRVEADQPRFTEGRYGQAVFIEYSEVFIRTNAFARAVSLAETTDGFEPVGDGRLSHEKEGPAASFEAIRVEAGPGGGLQTAPVASGAGSGRSVSLYVRGKAGTRVRLALESVEAGKIGTLAENGAVLSGEWERLQCHVTHAKGADRKAGPPVRLALTLPEGGNVSASAFMLETHGGYAGRHAASTWFPGQPMKRPGEILALNEAPDAREGTIAFWFRLEGALKWRTLLCIGDHFGWNSDLRLDLTDDERLALVLAKTKKEARVPQVREGWHHLAVSWDGPQALVYLDGAEVIRIDNAPERSRFGQVTLGGMAANFSPALRGDARLDEFALWKRPLLPSEVEELSRLEEPLGNGAPPLWSFANREPARVFARDQGERMWRFRLVPTAGAESGEAAVRFSIDGFFEGEATLPPATREGAEVAFPWSPARLVPGTYAMRFEIETPGGVHRFTRPVEIVPARMSPANAYVIPWGNQSPGMRELGFTAGSASTRSGLTSALIDDLTREGLYAQYRYNFTADAERDGDRFLEASGQRGKTDQASAQARAAIDHAAARFGEELSLHPQIRYVMLNCEVQFSWAHDFRDATREWVRETFGLDLSPWQRPGGSRDAVTLPFGRLKAAEGGYEPPADGIVARKDPFYAFHRWWHGPEAGNENFLNHRLAAGMRRSAPEVAYIGEPVLRRASLRAFGELDIVQEWFYFPDPFAAVRVQERARAAARRADGTHAGVGSMPQFILKPRMAAPYPGLPTPGMFREAAWHCLARPTPGFTYWNHWSVLERPSREAYTQEELDARFGVRPSWESVTARITVKGERSDTFLFIPELKDELARFHREDLHPLGPLVPRWENRPRRVAIFRSFAAELFNHQRWLSPTPLESAVEALQIPFDVLYDEDFETAAPDFLNRYSVLAIPNAPVLPEAALEPLRAFIARGGMIVVDEAFGPDLPGVTAFSWQASREDRKKLEEAEAALRREYSGSEHNNFREGMEALALQYASATGPTREAVAAMHGAIRPDAEILEGGNAFPNLLQCAGANYLAVVNTRRVPGPHYGHFGKVLEDGVAQSVAIAVAPELGAVAYDLLSHQPVPLTPEGGRHRLRIDLPPAGGRVLLFLPEETGALRSVPATLRAERGGSAPFEITLGGQSGKPLPGRIPARVETLGPGGKPVGDAVYTALENGVLRLEIPVAWNAAPGTYTLRVREAASGKTVTATFEVAPPAPR